MIAVRFAARLLLGAMVPAFFLAAWAIEFAPTGNTARRLGRAVVLAIASWAIFLFLTN